VDESRPAAVFVDLLEVNDQLGWIVLSICHDFGPEKSDNMIRDNFQGFILEISVIDAKISVEPVDFTRYQLVGDEALWMWATSVADQRTIINGQVHALLATSCSTKARCSSLPLKMGVL